MAESTLTLTLPTLRNRIAYYLGYGEDYSACTANQKADVDRAVTDGYRWFLFPRGVPGAGISHDWTFLRPTSQLTLWAAVAEDTTTPKTISGSGTTITASESVFHREMIGSVIVDSAGNSWTITAYTSAIVVTVDADATAVSALSFSIPATGRIRLPDDLASIDGDLIVTSPSLRGRRVEIVDLARVQLARQATESVGTPGYAALRPVRSDQSAGQRQELLVWPDADTDIVCDYCYVVRPDALVATTNEYPLGGMEYSDTVLQAMLAAAELRTMEGRPGPEMEMFVSSLKTAIETDRRKSPPSLGYNGDRSIAARGGRRAGGIDDCGATATYGGFLPPYL